MFAAPAIILTDSGAGESTRKISRLLEFFGVASQAMTVEDFILELTPDGKAVHVLGLARHFSYLAEKFGMYSGKLEAWKGRVDSVFSFRETETELEELVTGQFAGKVRLHGLSVPDQNWTVSEKCRDFTGPFAGLQVPPQSKPIFHCVVQGPGAQKIIFIPSGAAMMRLEFFGTPFFLSTSDIVDIDAPLPARDFDIRPHFLTAVPAVLYIKWAFAKLCWQPAETTACLVIDDPLLRPRYGHLEFQHLLGMMERLNFSTSVAFIPWNWNRSSRPTVQLFQDHASRFSLSIHGCDHTASEYGSRDRNRLAWKSRRAVDRMERHRQQTGLACDPVMVFPQGVFSEASMAALKQSGYIGTVNSEVISADPQPQMVTIAEYWDVALMKYSEFPIYTRRYPWAGVENFAFDVLLGKPCIVVIHHNDCHDGYQCLTECMERLNRLNVKLHWTSLAEVVRRSFRLREILPMETEVEMYGSEMRVRNPSAGKKDYLVTKRESAPGTIKQISIDGAPVKWSVEGKSVTFEMELPAGEAKTVSIEFQEIPVDDIPGEGLYYEAKVMLRRHLCEIRDNFLKPKKFST
jgi:hypothetical protein